MWLRRSVALRSSGLTFKAQWLQCVFARELCNDHLGPFLVLGIAIDQVLATSHEAVENATHDQLAVRAKRNTVIMGDTSVQERRGNELPPRIGRDVVPIGQLAKALRWSAARVRAVDDILRPIRLADGTRVYHVNRALAFIKVFDDMEAWHNERVARDRRNEQRRTARNIERVKRVVNAADAIGLLRLGAPADEYDSESREIVTWLPDCRTERMVQTKLHRLFARRFTQSVAGPSAMYAPLAKALYDARITRITVSIGGKP